MVQRTTPQLTTVYAAARGAHRSREVASSSAAPVFFKFQVYIKQINMEQNHQGHNRWQ